MSFTGFVSCVLVLSTAVFVVESLSLGRVDGGSQVLCSQAVLNIADEDMSPDELRYRRILIQNENENGRSDQERESDDYDEDDRSTLDLEWRKIRRYIKRQLKVPKRYLKKIVRTLGVPTSFRSAGEDERMVSLIQSPQTDDLNHFFSRSNGRLKTKRLLVMDEPETPEYFAVIATPGNRMYQ